MKRERRKRPGLPPLPVQLLVALRQYGASDPEAAVASAKEQGRLAEMLRNMLDLLAGQMKCLRADLRLDHTWMLRTRGYRVRPGKPVASWYTPHAHDPGYLLWRPQPPEFVGSHHTKTYVRGERGQLSDTALANRERRREKNPNKWTRLRGLQKPVRAAAAKVGNGKRKLRGRGFPPKGSRPFRSGKQEKQP